MARRVHRNPANPELFGEDLEPLAIEAIGLGLTAVVADKMVSPVVVGVVPKSSATLTKAVDAASTGLTAWLLGELISMANSRIGRLVRRGGMLLATGKGISILLPGFSLSGSLPTIPYLNPAPKAVVPELAAGNGNGTLALAQISPKYSTNVGL